MVFRVRKFEGALKKDNKIVTTRLMKKFDRDAFLNTVAGICWEQGLNETDDVDSCRSLVLCIFPLLLTSMLLLSQFGFLRCAAHG